MTRLSAFGIGPNPALKAWVHGKDHSSTYGWESYKQAITYRGWTLGFWGKADSGKRLFTMLSYPEVPELKYPLLTVKGAVRKHNPLILPFFSPALYQPNSLPLYLKRLPASSQEAVRIHVTSWHKEIYHDRS